MQSRKPEAKAFKRWVTHEVLPSIRKTGSYSVVQPTLAIPKTLPEALRAYADEVERREAAEKRAITAESERDEARRLLRPLRLQEVIGHDVLRRFVGDLSNQIVPIVGGFSYCPATRNERNHAHSKPLFE